MKTIAKNIKLHRLYSNLSQPQLAKATKISQQNISRWENGIIIPNIEFCIILADFYGISIDELVGHAPNVRKQKKCYLSHHSNRF